MDLITSYKNTELAPIYAGSGAVATISENGAILATPILDEINVIQLKPSRKKLFTINNEDEQEITALRITPDGKYLCFVSQAQLLKIVHVETGKIIRSMKISSPSYIMDSEATSTLIAVGGTDGSIIVVDIENGYITHSFKGHGGTISSLKFYGELSSNIWLLCSGDINGTVKVWDLVKRKCLHTAQEHNSAIRGIDIKALDNENLTMITGGRDDIINIWELNTKKKCSLTKTLPAHQQVESCGFIESDKYSDLIYTAGGDAIMQIISTEKNTVIKKTNQPIEELFIIGVLPTVGNTMLYSVMSDQSIHLLNVSKVLNDSSSIEMNYELSLAGNHGTIADMTFVGPDAKYLALATNSPTLRIIPIPTNEKDSEINEEDNLPIDVDMYEAHEDLLNAVASTTDGLWLATASKDKTAAVWKFDESLQKFKLYAKFIGHSSSVTAVALPNVMLKHWPEFILTVSNDLTIKKWSIPKPTGNENEVYEVKVSQYTRHAHDKDINAISLSPNDSIFATASYDKACKIWDLETGELTATLANHRRGLWDVAFCQYDKLVATCSGDKTIKIWSLDTFSVLKTLEGHTNAVQRCSFINKQKQLVSSGADGLIKIWDCSTGECLKTLDGHANRIWALTTQEDGKLIVSADADGVFQFWRDCTEEQKIEDMEKEKIKVEQEQSLQNYLNNEDWTNAFLLAITLDHPMRLFNVLRRSLEYHDNDESTVDKDTKAVIFNKELDHVISTLTPEQLLLLMKRCRDWNTNARTHTIAQKCIRCILLHHNIGEISEIPGMIKLIDGIIPYTGRHFARLDNLIEQSYILDYALVEMDKLF